MNEWQLNQLIQKMVSKLKRVPVTTAPKVAVSFLLNTYDLPTAADLRGGSPCLQPSVFRNRQQWVAL